jgi:hypothetical protein
MPARLVLDGELVAFHDGKPSFPCCAIASSTATRMRPLRSSPLTFSTQMVRPLHRSRSRNGAHCWSQSTLSGPSTSSQRSMMEPRLFDAVCRDGLEGIVAERLRDPYKPGERAWVKITNSGYWRRTSAAVRRRGAASSRSRRAGSACPSRASPSRLRRGCAAGSRG